MAENTKIEWATHTFNPWEGCQKVGPGCDHCYAEARNQRFVGGTNWGPGAPRRRTSVQNWNLPRKWNREAKASGTRPRVFCASLADVFDNAVDPAWRVDLFHLISQTPNLDWLLLTKRPGNIAAMMPSYSHTHRSWPNVWLGCTVVNQAEADRDIPKLLALPAKVRFLSIEPMLGPIDLRKWIGVEPIIAGLSSYQDQDGFVRQDIGGGIMDGLGWIICGGESGPHARPMHPDWARLLRDQCKAAGVPFLFKQWGDWAVTDDPEVICSVPTAQRDFLGASIGEAMIRVGKKRAGRILDGRSWDEVPG